MAERTPLEPQAITGIGSLPHHNIDAALKFAFRHSLPFLPQIPIRNPWEYMIPQALEGMPGLMAGKEGETSLDYSVWAGRHRAFDARLLEAFSHTAAPEAFAAFEPSAAASSSWQPFLWELEERGVKTAKIQIAGPLTCQWVLRLSDGTPASKQPEVATQIFRLVLARGIAMCRRLGAHGIQPVIYLDEPALYGFSPTNPRHALGLEELRLIIQALRKEGAWVGLHCCSNTDWDRVLGLGLDLVSLDVELSLEELLRAPSLGGFLDGGGRLSLGIVPTSPGHGASTREPAELAEGLLSVVSRAGLDGTGRAKTIVGGALFTAACGLALHSPADAEAVVECLVETVRLLKAK